MVKSNQFIYDVSDGTVKGCFRIYQARNGSIQLLMGKNNTALTKKQLDDLKTDVYDLTDFDYDMYVNYYK